MLERWLVAWLFLISIVAYFWPPEWLDPFLETEPYLLRLFAVTMFVIGWMLPRDEIEQLLRRWPTVLAGTTLQYLSMPALAFLMVRLFGIHGNLAVGVILVGCVPGAMASNVLTLVARGNLSYSLSLTTMATLLSPFVVPLALYWILGASVEIEIVSVFTTLCFTVVLPVLGGHALGRLQRVGSSVVQKVGPTIANLTILWIIAVVVATNRDQLAQLSPRLIFALLFLNLAGYAVGFIGGRLIRLTSGMGRALTLEIGMQNAGLGAALAMKFEFAGETSAIAPALYTFGCMLTGTMLARMWSAREPRGSP